MKRALHVFLVGVVGLSLGLLAFSIVPTKNNAVSAKATAVALQPGEYTVGADINPGRYTVTPQNGSGNFYSDPKKSSGSSLNEVLGTGDPTYVPSVTANFKKGDKVKMEGIPSVQFTPVTKRNKNNTTMLGAGIWVVGKDIKKGKYQVTPGQGQSGNFTVEPKSMFGSSTNEILGDDTSAGQVPKINATLRKGDTIQIQGMSQVNFSKK